MTWLTTEEACAYLRCSPGALYQHLYRGKLTAGRLGTRYRFSQESLDACLLVERPRKRKRPEACASAGEQGRSARG